MDYFLMIVFFFVCIFIVGLILLQEGKGGGLAAMGAGAMDSVMGARNPLRRWTVYLVVLFVLLTFGINYSLKSDSGSEPPPGMEEIDVEDESGVAEAPTLSSDLADESGDAGASVPSESEKAAAAADVKGGQGADAGITDQKGEDATAAGNDEGKEQAVPEADPGAEKKTSATPPAGDPEPGAGK